MIGSFFSSSCYIHWLLVDCHNTINIRYFAPHFSFFYTSMHVLNVLYGGSCNKSHHILDNSVEETKMNIILGKYCYIS
jgi:hypothetical protein